jgi:putative iron-regulated protein
MLHKNLLLIVALVALACSACSDTESDSTPTVDNAAVVSTYSQVAYESYNQALIAAETMDSAIRTFVGAPSFETMNAAKEAWLAARVPYLQTEVFRFYNGPIDNEETGPEGLLNAWPMDEAYIDYTVDTPNGGLINNSAIELTAANLESLNEASDERGGEAEVNIATGFHAIEFLLWGQDEAGNETAGTRPHTDFVEGADGTAANQDRRKLYLTTVSSMLLGHLRVVKDAWAAGDANNYRAAFEAAEPTESIKKIMIGLSLLSGFETGGERLQTALDTGDQEDEHSCFSDNTHVDMIEDIRGIQNVYEGTYGAVSGPSIRDFVATRDQALAASIGDQIDSALAASLMLPVPFDNGVALGNTEGRAKIADLVTKLLDTQKLIEDAFRAFGFDVPVAE